MGFASVRIFRLALRIGCAALWLAQASPSGAHPEIEAQIAGLTARIAQDPSDAALYLRRGELYRIHRDFRPAEADYRRAERKDPALAAIDLCRGQMLFDEGELGTARQALDRFLDRRPGDAEGRVVRARVLFKLGLYLNAARDWSAAIDGVGAGRGVDHGVVRPEPRPEYYEERALALAAAGAEHLEEALAGLDAGLVRLGQPISLQLLAIDLELRSGRNDNALQRLDRIDASAPGGNPALTMRRARILEQAHRAADARAAYALAVSQIHDRPEDRRHTRAMSDLEGEAQAALARLQEMNTR